ncbi:MAG: chlorophyll a/b-binding protein [Vulcanococcus sp.]
MRKASGQQPAALGWLSVTITAMQRVQHWGFTSQAELWNGRLAMLGFVIAIATELLTGQGVVQQLRALLPGLGIQP